MQVKSIAECSPWSILQYFSPSLSYHLSFRSLFCLFLSDRFTVSVSTVNHLKSYVPCFVFFKQLSNTVTHYIRHLEKKVDLSADFSHRQFDPQHVTSNNVAF